MISSISLYFHIPFCTKKCPYCHFYVVPNRPDLQQVLLEGLRQEWIQRLPLIKGKQITSIYFGGGTPTLFPSGIQEICSWFSELDLTSDCEITIEGNPEELDLLLLKMFHELGINRLSLGIQSLDDSSLQLLERVHSAKKGRQAIFDAARAGFENISIDLMYDLPSQTKTSWQRTLSSLSDLPLTHLSLYNLTIEPHTVFFKRKKSLQPTLPNQEESLELLEMALDTLKHLGFERYEISAFAKGGLYSRHNTGYWTGRPFLGFGPSAFSYWEGKRFRNIAHLQRYRRMLGEGSSPSDFEEELPYPANVNELLAVRLRLLEGVDLSLSSLPSETHAALSRLIENGLLEKQGARIALTPRGRLFYDTVAEEIIS